MQSVQNRLAFLQRLKPILRTIVDPLTFSSIAILKHDNNHWIQGSNLVVPELQSLLE